MAYSIKELCAIIKACNEAGVSQLKIGELELSLTPKAAKPEKPRPLTPEEIQAAKQYENEVFLENENRVKLEELSHIRLSDPEAYEDLVARGELEHVGEESDGTDAG